MDIRAIECTLDVAVAEGWLRQGEIVRAEHVITGTVFTGKLSGRELVRLRDRCIMAGCCVILAGGLDVPRRSE